jgi:hypothetical protein
MPAIAQPSPFPEEQLSGWKYFSQLGRVLERLHGHKDHFNRNLHYDQYVSLLLLYFFNPVVTSLRGVQFASTLQKVQSKLATPRAALGSLSEASHVFDADLLSRIFTDLASQAQAGDGVLRPRDIPDGLHVIIQDGTLLNALPHMIWALWRQGQCAVKAHVQFDLFKSIPVNVALTSGGSSEKDAFEKMLAPNCLYLIDRGYLSYALFQKIIDSKSSFVARAQDNTLYEILEERPLSDAARKAGVLLDVKAVLGSHLNREALNQPLRLIKIHVTPDPAQAYYSRRGTLQSKINHRVQEEGGVIVIVTDRFDLTPELLALLYRYRWQIELFFRWFKCILGCKHLLAHSENGLRIQLYVALIASLLIVLWTGRKPTKRTLEMMQFYFQGWATDEELDAHIGSLKKPK